MVLAVNGGAATQSYYRSEVVSFKTKEAGEHKAVRPSLESLERRNVLSETPVIDGHSGVYYWVSPS